MFLFFSCHILFFHPDIGMDWVGDFDDNSANSTSYADTPVAVNAVVGTVLLLWVAILEGAQCSIVGLSTVDIEAFKYSHPRAYKTCQWLHQGSNLERFIVGRQFLLLFIVFLISKMFSYVLPVVR